MKDTRMKTGLGMLMLGILGLAASGAQADWSRDGYGHRPSEQVYRQSMVFGEQIRARQERQVDRIRAGMRDGGLTRQEFRELMHEQHRIRAMERHFRDDGIIDTREFQRLDHALDLASHDIWLERHDRQANNAYGSHPRFD